MLTKANVAAAGDANGAGDRVGKYWTDGQNKTFGVGRQYQTRGIVGEMDDVRVYDSALTTEQVSQLFLHELALPRYIIIRLTVMLRDAGNAHGDKIGSGGPARRRVRGGDDLALAFNNDYGVEILTRHMTTTRFRAGCEWMHLRPLHGDEVI